MRDGHPADGLHRLNRNGTFEIEAYEDLEKAEGDEDSQGIHFVQGDISHHKRDQCAQVPESSGKLHLIIVITPQPHGRLQPDNNPKIF